MLISTMSDTVTERAKPLMRAPKLALDRSWAIRAPSGKADDKVRGAGFHFA